MHGDPHQMRGCESCSQPSSCFLRSGYRLWGQGVHGESPPPRSGPGAGMKSCRPQQGRANPCAIPGAELHPGPCPLPYHPLPSSTHSSKVDTAPARPPTHEWFPVGVVEWAENLVTRTANCTERGMWGYPTQEACSDPVDRPGSAR